MFEALFAMQPRSLMDMPKNDARIILSARSWVLLKSARKDPLSRIAGYLRSVSLALRFCLLMEAVQQIWPHAFAIHRPCCGFASLDEALLVHMVQLGMAGARPEFDMLLKEMIGEDGRNLLYARSSQMRVMATSAE
jgi:hypothetical protein